MDITQSKIISVLADFCGPTLIAALFYFLKRYVDQQDIEQEKADKKRNETNEKLTLITGQMTEIRSDARLVSEFTARIESLQNDMALIKQSQKKSWEKDDELERSIGTLRRQVDNDFEAVNARLVELVNARIVGLGSRGA